MDLDTVDKFIVTPWDVEGDIDYTKLIKKFGVSPLEEKTLNRLKMLACGELHTLLRRGVFFSHRDLNWLMDEYEKGNKFYLYTGRGPSGNIHLGHLVPWILTKWLQDKFGVEFIFQLTDDEKFYFSKNLKLDEANKFAHDNMLDVMALGFDPKLTRFIINSEHAGVMYPLAAKVAKRITFSTAKAVFGFKNDSNVGQIFYTAMQSVPAFIKSVEAGKNIPCLIPLGIDQDPHFRVSRDIMVKLGYYKPAILHSRFLPGLKENGKMSASDQDSAIFTGDSKKQVIKKIGRAFTGGRETLQEQKDKGGRPEICNVYQYFYMLFEDDDNALEERKRKCLNGELLCGECKKELAKRINVFLERHSEEKEKAKKIKDELLF